jgi:membrane protein implicated in regulation of membrane protease activity
MKPERADLFVRIGFSVILLLFILGIISLILWGAGSFYVLGGILLLLSIAAILLLLQYRKQASTIDFLQVRIADLEDAKRRDERRIKQLLAEIRELKAD